MTLRAKPSVRYEIGGTWGNHAEWLNIDREPHRATGHHTPPPGKGDLLYAPMHSGRVGVYRLSRVKVMHDPPDQWFADAKWVGYEDETDA